MEIRSEFSLKGYNTFGIDSVALRVVMLDEEDDFRMAATTAETPFLILGGGSNMVLPDRYEGTVYHPENKGICAVGSHDDHVFVEAAAGEVWADFVDYCISQGWYGVENLAGIPGTVGAAPVQNVGAYGMEAKDVVEAVHCFEIGSGDSCWIAHEDCQFAYRWSRFKGEWNGRYLIDKVRFRLNTIFSPNLTYKALATAVSSVEELTARRIADTVVAIRDGKLPNPKEIGSAGSFFKNPIVDAETYGRLINQWPDMVAFAVEDGRYKLAAGWLIERCGWKGKTLGRAGVYEKQALVLVNRGGATGAGVVALAEKIVADVKDKFGVEIEPEAIIIS